MNNIATKIGEKLLIKSQVIVGDYINITSYSDRTSGEGSDKFFKKFFRYSLDGVNYSEYEELDDKNISKINGKTSDLIIFEFIYERAGKSDKGALEFLDIKLNGNVDYQIVQNKATLDSIFNDIVKNNFYSLKIRNNVLNKLFSTGIIPKFIDREGDGNDFISLWGAVSIFFSYFSAFSENLEKLLYNKKNLSEYLIQNNICIDSKNELYESMYYICTNMYDEIRRRGTVKVIADSEDYKGELLRLICKLDKDEFIYEIIKKENRGFCLSKSSPMYNGTYNSEQLNKVLELSKYNKFGDSKDTDYGSVIIRAKGGVGYKKNEEPIQILNLDELVKVDDSLDYELILNVKKNKDNNLGKLVVSIEGYNENGVLIFNSIERIKDSISENYFINEDIDKVLKIRDLYYQFRLILFSSFSKLDENDSNNSGYGNNLRFSGTSKKVNYILFNIYLESDNGIVEIKDFKFRPLIRGKNIRKREIMEKDRKVDSLEPFIKNPQFLQSNEIFYNYRKNRNESMNSKDVDLFISEFLIPYQLRIISVDL